MNKQNILEKITLSTLTEALTNIEAFEQSYNHIQSNDLEAIKNRIQTNLELDTALINDIKDCISISEERAFIIGLIEGIKLMKSAEKL